MHYDTIYNTYKRAFYELPEAKRFHLATRLSLFGDTWAAERVKEMRAPIIGAGPAEIRNRMEQLGDSLPDPKHLNAASLRLPIFAEESWLFGYELQLFQALHAKVQYDMDIRKMIPKPVENTSETLDALTNDPYTLTVLSTYLVDTFYLQARLMQNDETKLIELASLEQALKQPLDDNYKAKLSVYLLTHCIIAETMFYSRPIPADKSDYYSSIGRLLESLISTKWDSLTLDIKLEVAVCMLLIKVDSVFIKKAIDDADASFDASLGYIVDPKVPHKNDLAWAEHRNVLYLMAVGELS